MAQLVSEFILSRLDYCNAVLVGLPRATLDTLQRVQNAAACLVLNLRLRDHVTPALNQLHWLPVAGRIKFKLCLLMHLITQVAVPGRHCSVSNYQQSQTSEIVRNNGLRQTNDENEVR